MSATTFRHAIDDAIARLAAAGVASPGVDAWSLASHVTSVARGELQARAVIDAVEWSAQHAQAFEEVLLRRIAREPLWHITGTAPFLSLELSVGPGVFTPRPETELLAHQALDEAASMHPVDGFIRVVDLCAGTGAIGLWLASQLGTVEVLSVEVSPQAAKYLQDNIARLAPHRAHALVADLEDASMHPWSGTVDLVVSNPPYLIPGEEVDQETMQFDPGLALYGGEDGLEVIRRVVVQAGRLLRPGGVVFIEHGIGHREDVVQMLTAEGFGEVHTERDLLGRDRFTRARWRGPQRTS